MVEEFMRINLRVGISTQGSVSEDYVRLMDEANIALTRIATKDSSLNVYMPVNRERFVADLVDVETIKMRIVELLSEDEFEETKNVIQDFSKELVNNSVSFEQCQLYMLVIYSALIHKIVSYQLDTMQDFNELERDLYNRIHSAKTVYGLIEVGHQTVDKLSSLSAGKKHVKNELVKRVDDCIRQNYKADLNLNFISNTLYLNGSYVSRAYKKLTGMTVTEKINQYRISKAKDLIRNTNLKIYEVAEEVGFNDAAYFTNVFIKYCGINPTEFRVKEVEQNFSK